MADAEPVKKRTFRKFTYRGVDLEKLLDMNTDELVQLFHARARRRYEVLELISLSKREEFLVTLFGRPNFWYRFSAPCCGLCIAHSTYRSDILDSQLAQPIE